MKDINFKLILAILTVSLLGLSMLIVSSLNVQKPLIIGLFLVVSSFCVLVAISTRRITQVEGIDRQKNKLDIIFSTFELHAKKLPEDIDLIELELANHNIKNNNGSKVNSFENHL